MKFLLLAIVSVLLLCGCGPPIGRCHTSQEMIKYYESCINSPNQVCRLKPNEYYDYLKYKDIVEELQCDKIGKL